MKKAQKLFKETNKGWFNSETQQILGIKGAEVNRQNQTGGFDPLNLAKANKALAQKLSDPQEKAKFEKTQKENLTKVAFGYSSLKGAIARDASFFHIKK